MNWTSITATDLNDTKVAALVTACRTAALGAGQVDPVPAIIVSVVDRIRAEIAGCKSNRLDLDTTKIPKSLKSLAARMIVRAAQSRLNIALKEDEREEQKNDIRYLERIARCELPVETPDTPIEAPIETGAALQMASNSPRKSTRDSLQGL